AAAAEAGLPATEFAKRLRAVPALTRVLGPLQARGGTVSRQVYLDTFSELARELRLGHPSVVDSDPAPTAPFAGHGASVLSLAFSPDGRLALSGCGDNFVRLWEVPSGKELRRFEAHTAPVYALAFSADGRQAISSGQDRTIRHWDVASGREVGSFTGH